MVNILVKMSKKGDFENQLSLIVILVLNHPSISAIFQIVQIAGNQKNALTGESLYSLNFTLEFFIMIFVLTNQLNISKFLPLHSY